MSICGHLLYEESIYYLFEYPKSMKRRIIAHVAYCAKEGKHGRIAGDLRRLEGCPPEFTGTSWALALQHAPFPPFYFVKRGNILVPLNVPQGNSEAMEYESERED